MPSNKSPFTLRIEDRIFDKMRIASKKEHHSMNNMIEYILLEYLKEYESKNGEIVVDYEE